MYPVENGIYHVRRSGMSVAMEYLRISEQECAELYKASEDELYFKYQLFNLGIVDRWKRESEELIAEPAELKTVRSILKPDIAFTVIRITGFQKMTNS